MQKRRFYMNKIHLLFLSLFAMSVVVDVVASENQEWSLITAQQKHNPQTIEQLTQQNAFLSKNCIYYQEELTKKTAEIVRLKRLQQETESDILTVLYATKHREYEVTKNLIRVKRITESESENSELRKKLDSIHSELEQTKEKLTGTQELLEGNKVSLAHLERLMDILNITEADLENSAFNHAYVDILKKIVKFTPEEFVQLMKNFNNVTLKQKNSSKKISKSNDNATRVSLVIDKESPQTKLQSLLAFIHKPVIGISIIALIACIAHVTKFITIPQLIRA
jgi:hypothetical protein